MDEQTSVLDYFADHQNADQDTDRPEWEEPVPLDVYALPPLPERVLPDPFDSYAKALSASTETPLELALMDILSVTAAATQGRYAVEVKPGYTEPVNIWTMPIQPPGTRKTQVKKETMQPLTEWERDQKISLKEAIQERESERKTLLKRIERKRTEASKADSDEDYKTLSGEVSKLERELPEPLRPPRIWTEDITPETLGVLMAQNRECMSILSAEGGIFGIMAGRYSKGQPNLDIFLKGHAGEPVRVDRGSREPVYLENPRLTVGLSVQPEILHGLSATSDFRGRGLLARFLYVYPGNNLGHRGLDTVELSGSHRIAYTGRILALLNKPWNTDQHGRECPYLLRLSPGAYAVWAEFWHHIEAMLGDGCRLSHIRDWGSKLPGAIARVAALFHCIRHATVEPADLSIGKDDAVLAVDLGRILIEHALKVFDCMSLDENHEGARVVVKWIRKNRLVEFSVRECAKNHRSRFKTVEELYPALKILEDAGWIRQKDPGKGRGRPIRAYLVNPEAIKNEHV